MRNLPYGATWPKGSTIEMHGERLRIRENWGDRGVVEHLDGELANNNFQWIFQGDKAQLVALPARDAEGAPNQAV